METRIIIGLMLIWAAAACLMAIVWIIASKIMAFERRLNNIEDNMRTITNLQLDLCDIKLNDSKDRTNR